MLANASRFFVLPLIALTLSIFAAPLSASAKGAVFTATFSDVAIRGYDTVAYFTQQAAVKGSRDHEHEWNGATWRFSSAENRDLFAANPEQYAPQYGGYCAYAASQGYTASTDPEAWHITGGKLYLNYSKAVQRRWLQDRDNYIEQADSNWPRLLADLTG